jgi:iron complex transport system substrate-binding protein
VGAKNIDSEKCLEAIFVAGDRGSVINDGSWGDREEMKKIKTPHLTGILLALFFVCVGTVAAADQGPVPQYARGFEVEAIAGGRLVTILPTWNEGGPAFRYLLVPRGRAVPKEHPPAQVIFVPVRRVVSLSTTHLAYMDSAGLTDRLVGLASFKHVNTLSVRRRIDAGALKEVGPFTNLKIETLIDLAPDLILASASGSVCDVHPKLQEAGLPVTLMIDHLEAHPLGRAEWIKFLGLFFDTVSHAETLFAQIEARYKHLAQTTARVSSKPAVITGAPFQGQWWVPGADSFVARLIADAGGKPAWPQIPGAGSQPMDLEAVYEKALAADVWLNTGSWRSIAEARAADPRFSDLPALQRGLIYNNNKRLNPWGGNDYWESGMLRPDAVLADVIAILHPGLLPDHELVYYQRLERQPGVHGK